MKPRNTAAIVEKKGKLLVRIDLADGRIIHAVRSSQGRITYDHPEHVPRVMKQSVVPALFKDIDKRLFG